MFAVNVAGLSFAYPGGETLLTDLNFTVAPGEHLVVAGLSGCGKSTLCHLLCGMIPQAVKGQMTGKIEVWGEDIGRLTLPQIARRVGFVFQDAESQLICTTVEDELAFGLENLCFAPWEIRQRVEEALAAWNMQAWRLQDPATLSGGQQKLLTIAAVLILGARILILDEPFAALDAAGRRLVRQAIEREKQAGRTIIQAEHNLTYVQEADRWLILQRGRVHKLAPAHELLANLRELRALGVWL